MSAAPNNSPVLAAQAGSQLVDRVGAARIADMSASHFDALRAEGRAPSPHICEKDRKGKPRRVRWLRRHIELWNDLGQPDAATFAKRLQSERRR